jgi:hypothetical protein
VEGEYGFSSIADVLFVIPESENGLVQVIFIAQNAQGSGGEE